MNFKITFSILVVIALTAGLLFIVNANKEIISLEKNGPVKSESYLKCEELIKEITDEPSCDKKWAQFEAEFNPCETFPLTEPSETEVEPTTFRDIIFNIADCHEAAKNT